MLMLLCLGRNTKTHTTKGDYQKSILNKKIELYRVEIGKTLSFLLWQGGEMGNKHKLLLNWLTMIEFAYTFLYLPFICKFSSELFAFRKFFLFFVFFLCCCCKFKHFVSFLFKNRFPPFFDLDFFRVKQNSEKGKQFSKEIFNVSYWPTY